MIRALRFVALALLTAMGLQGDRSDGGTQQDKVQGVIWKYKLNNDGKVRKGQVRVFNLKVYNGRVEIGTVEPNGAKTRLTITDRFPPLQGTIKMVRVKQRPIVWRGTLERPNGNKVKIEMTVDVT